MMIEFIAAVYNEEKTISDLIDHVYSYVWRINIVDDGSTDDTAKILSRHASDYYKENYEEPYLDFKTIQHTGLPETVKREALRMCDPDSWVIMLDADERFAPGVLEQIIDFVNSPMSNDVDHVWFTLDEYIDDQYAGRTFVKCRLFKAWAGHFADTIHVADWFDGKGANFGWRVLHKKTREKQEMREKEYIETYKRLVDEGLMRESKMWELRSMHYFIK